MTNISSIDRFVSAQKKDFNMVRSELLKGKKEMHWMWYMFPQIKGLGTSFMSEFYGLDGKEEAKRYFQNEYLKSNILELIDILLSYKEGTNIEDVFGLTDSKKLCSCMTIFYLATKEQKFKEVIGRYFNGILDENTIFLLQNML